MAPRIVLMLLPLLAIAGGCAGSTPRLWQTGTLLKLNRVYGKGGKAGLVYIINTGELTVVLEDRKPSGLAPLPGATMKFSTDAGSCLILDAHGKKHKCGVRSRSGKR